MATACWPSILTPPSLTLARWNLPVVELGLQELVTTGRQRRSAPRRGVLTRSEFRLFRAAAGPPAPSTDDGFSSSCFARPVRRRRNRPGLSPSREAVFPACHG